MLTVADERLLTDRLSRMTDDELVDFQLNLMNLVIEKKMDEGKIVFSEVENGLLN